MVNVFRFYPEARSVHIERAAKMQGRFYYLHRRDDFDEELAFAGSFEKVSLLELVRNVWRDRPDTLELPEPMWFKYFIPQMTLALAAKLRSTRSRRIRLVTYSIENSTADRLPRPLARLHFPAPLWRALSCFATRIALRNIDRIAFGTAGARAAILDTVGEKWYSRLRIDEALFEALPTECDCPNVPRVPGQVLFVGALEERKGFHLLAEAWPLVKEAIDIPSSLQIAGAGQLDHLARSLAADPTNEVSVLGSVSRVKVHELMRSSSLVVLPSQPHHRWREQVGLPIAEAVAHGTAVLTTDETGLSEWLKLAGQTILETPTSPRLLAGAIQRILTQGAATAYSLPTVDQRLAADAWLVAAPD